MLSYFLAIAIAIMSVGLYLTAFLSPKIHRQDDFLWSGLGLFYGLILWICAGRITGALLLGQLAATSIIIAFIWETRQLRKAITAQETEVKLAGISILDLILSLLSKLSNLTRKQPPVTQTSQPESETKPTPSATADLTQKEESTDTETKEVISTETVSLTPETSDSIPSKEEEDKELLIETPVVKEEKQPEISEEKTVTPDEKLETEESTTASVTPQSSPGEKDQISDSSLDNEIEKERETESDGETPSPIETKPESVTTEEKSESEKQGFFSKLISGVTKFWRKKPSQASPTTKDKDQLDNIQAESSQVITPLESNLEISSPETESEIKEDLPASDGENLESQSIVEANLDLETKEENKTPDKITVESDAHSKPKTVIDQDLDSDENENQSENKEREEDINFELEFTDESETSANVSSDFNLDLDLELKELNMESRSLSPAEEIDLSDNIDSRDDLDADLDDLSPQIEEKEETSEKEDVTLSEEVPEEDKINLLTDLISEEQQSSLEEDLNDILAESDLKSKPENKEGSTKEEDS